ncbi:MAG: recombination protein RecR [Bordetella sp.]|nr:MAG: recombination protein RecR [Bordetella sp.]
MDHQPLEPEPLLSLITALRRLPGIGLRSARRISYYMLQHDLQGLDILSRALSNAVINLCHCIQCNNFSENELCSMCSNSNRDSNLLCIVETPADRNILEASRSYHGLYYVLMGHLAPLDGIGTHELSFERVLKRASDGIVKEVILATNFTAEGETTAHFLSEALAKIQVKVSRLARGVPAGSELEYVDAGTVAWAMMERKPT